MSKKSKKARKKTPQPTSNAPASAPAPAAKKPSSTDTSQRTLLILAVLGAIAALWAVFLWTELVAARKTGAEPFCAFGESDCGLLWDAAFASQIHRFTGLPVAAWGVVWGVVAMLMPIFARGTEGRQRAWRYVAVKWTAVAGLASFVALLAASAYEGLFCTSCALTYVVTLAYVGITFFGLQPPVPLRVKGLELAAAATAAVFVLLLYPGIQTPKSRSREDQRVLEEAARRQAAEQPSAAEGSAESSNLQLDGQLREFLDNAQPELKQNLANALHLYREAPNHVEDPRFLQGSYDAPVRITEFTDALCSHCATLHLTLRQLHTMVPEGAFSVDARHYPLDGNCNSDLPARGAESVRCAAARMQICMEGTPRASELTGAIFAEHRGLRTEDQLFDIARGYDSRSALKACMSSDETAEKLAADVAYASHFDPTGTPLVLINGREAPSWGPFLYAMIMAQGNDRHPAFDALPAPSAPPSGP